MRAERPIDWLSNRALDPDVPESTGDGQASRWLVEQSCWVEAAS